MISRTMLQAATDATGFVFAVDDAPGGRTVLTVFNDEKELAKSPQMTEARLEAWLYGLLAGVQCSRRKETTEAAK